MLAAAWQFALFGTPARLVRPWALLLAGVALLLGLVWARSLWRRGALLRATVPERRRAVMAPRAGTGRTVVGGGLSLVGLCLLGVAASQPQCGTHTSSAKRVGLDVVIAIDASNSMLARDVKPSRLARAKLELGALIDRLPGDRVGIVAFAGDAFVQCPLTTDHAAAKLFLKAVEPDALPQQGTALADALETSAALFEGADRGETGKALVVITDGEDHKGDVEAAAGGLESAGVRVFTVGVGSKSGEPIPVLAADGSVTGYKKDREGRTVMTRLNDEVLQTVASKTRGRYVHSAMGDLGVGEVAEEIGRMKKGEFETTLTVHHEDRYEAWAWPGLVLVLLGFSAGEGRWPRRRREGT